MKVMKKTLSLLLVFAMLFALAACGSDDNPTSTGSSQGEVSGEKSTYTVKLTTAGGMALSGYQVLVYADEACTDLVDVATTDSNGNASWSLKKDTQYYFKLDDTQLQGYDVKDSYAFNGTSASITLTSALIQGEDVTAKTFQLGDVMYDFSFQDSTRVICGSCGAVNTSCDQTEEGNVVTRTKCAECDTALDWEKPQYVTVTLSEELAKNDLVVLNFWYVDCSACVSEFPVLQQAYEIYTDSVQILAINPSEDTDADIASFGCGKGLEFPMGKVTNTFNPQSFIDPTTNAACGGYPTSIFVDRYGVICLIEVGAMTSLTEWSSILGHFVGDDYEQKLAVYADELVERMKPTYENPSAEEIDAAFTGEADLNVNYYWEADDDYSWPFLAGQKDGRDCIYASNSKIYESYSILYAQIELEEGDVLAFDYWASSELNYDVLYVIVDDQPIYTLSGVQDSWNSAYCWIADKAGTVELALCYQKDTDNDEGDDTIYLSNLRVVTLDDIDTASYLPRQAAKEHNGSYTYADIYLNENDGYYHVGSVDGPLLLAGLYDYTQFSEDEYLYLWAADGQIVVDKHDYYEDLLPYFSAATNSNLLGWCTVTEELGELLKIVASIKGFSGDENEWMLLCKYYDAYGTDGAQLEDPVAGLKTWSALTALEGVGIETNSFYYNGNPIMPRGKLARFIPEKSGVYRITSSTAYTEGLDAWIFDVDYNMLYQYEGDEMLGSLYADSNNVTMVMYMEAGVDYYIDIAPYDVYAECVVNYDITYLGESYDLFRLCSSGPFTYIENGPTDKIISLGIDVVLCPEDGYYHEDLGKDENGNQIYGSIIYASFGTGTAVISTPIYPTMIELGGFNFSMSETDQEILAYYEQFDYDKDALLEYLAGLTVSYDLVEVEEILEGIYHGKGEDYTEEIRSYVEKMIDYTEEHPELAGCVPVDARLAELLQMAMDKYTFEGVVNSWLKMCFYYDHLGAPEDAVEGY